MCRKNAYFNIIVVVIQKKRIGGWGPSNSFGMALTIYNVICEDCRLYTSLVGVIPKKKNIGGAPTANSSFDMTLTNILRGIFFAAHDLNVF